MTAQPFALAESSELAHALVARVLRDHGIRALFLKGPVATAQGLLPQRVSSDVDVLCDPSQMRQAEGVFDGLGWLRYHGGNSDMVAIGMHATTFVIPGWPCTVDIHNHFPGLLAPAAEAFAMLWSRRELVTLAHREVPAPSPADHFAVIAVHALRNADGAPPLISQPTLRESWARLEEAHRSQVPHYARSVGALEPLRSVLIDLGGDPGPVDQRFAAELTDWNAVRERPGDSAVLWASRWRRTAWRDRPELVFRAFWDISMDRAQRPEQWALASRRERVSGRIRRSARGIRQLPRAAWALARRARKSE
ncbi:MAG: nucleotidyltransferase family protein [Tetrasphaera sp.]|jgi:hypothetical protein|nr:nucleotidyltransferase family protein [Tetrasphaera sp.]